MLDSSFNVENSLCRTEIDFKSRGDNIFSVLSLSGGISRVLEMHNAIEIIMRILLKE